MFQLHARLERGVVTIDVPLRVNLCKKSVPRCKNFSLQTFLFYFITFNFYENLLQAEALV